MGDPDRRTIGSAAWLAIGWLVVAVSVAELVTNHVVRSMLPRRASYRVLVQSDESKWRYLDACLVADIERDQRVIPKSALLSVRQHRGTQLEQMRRDYRDSLSIDLVTLESEDLLAKLHYPHAQSSVGKGELSAERIAAWLALCGAGAADDPQTQCEAAGLFALVGRAQSIQSRSDVDGLLGFQPSPPPSFRVAAIFPERETPGDVPDGTRLLIMLIVAVLGLIPLVVWHVRRRGRKSA